MINKGKCNPFYQQLIDGCENQHLFYIAIGPSRYGGARERVLSCAYTSCVNRVAEPVAFFLLFLTFQGFSTLFESQIACNDFTRILQLSIFHF